MNRRQWSRLAGVGAAASALAGTGWLILRAWLPWVSVGPDGRWWLGPKARFTPGTVTLLRRAKAIVVHDQMGIHVVSAICTHQRCMIHDVPARRELSCPCHGAAFDYDGRVLRGPTDKPLPWLEVREEAGELVLDPSRRVDGPDAT